MKRLERIVSHLGDEGHFQKSIRKEITASNLPPEFLRKLMELLGPERMSTQPKDLELHGKDRSHHPSRPPLAVLYPSNESEVVGIMKLCNEYKVAIVPFGRGTSVEGHIAALHPLSVTVNFSRHFNKVLAIHPDDMDVVVEPGVSYEKLNEVLKPHGLFFSADPGPGATIGGMIATSCSGPNAVRYGTMKAQVLSLRVVLANGEVIKTGNRAKKSSAGYDLTHLFIGSEGTLGLVTQATLIVRAIPEHVSAAIASFPSEKEACLTVMELIRCGVLIGRVELLDALMIKAVNKRSKLSLAELATLIFEFSGSKAHVMEQIKKVEQLAAKHGGTNFKYATEEKEIEELWHARKVALYSAKAMRPHADFLSTDVAVPISRLAECIEKTRQESDASFLLAPLVGHAGDGNFHLIILFDPNDPKEEKEAHRIHKKVVELGIEMEGTCTGEHGIGYGKKDSLIHELGIPAINVMKTIKQALDPHFLLNPGKVI